jgi:hypothetical protein
MYSAGYCWQILMKLEFCRQIFEKYSVFTFNENTFRADRRTVRHDEISSRFSKFCEKHLKTLQFCTCHLVTPKHNATAKAYDYIMGLFEVTISLSFAHFVVVVIIFIISFLQGIYTYIPLDNHVPRQYIVAAILSLLFMVPISPVPALALLYFYVSTFQSMCAVPNMAVFCSSS